MTVKGISAVSSDPRYLRGVHFDRPKVCNGPRKAPHRRLGWGLFVLGGAQYNLVQRVGQYAIFTECAGADRLNAV